MLLTRMKSRVACPRKEFCNYLGYQRIKHCDRVSRQRQPGEHIMGNQNNNGANLGFESELWRAADAMRSNMDAAEYKHVVLGLIFLKYILKK